MSMQPIAQELFLNPSSSQYIHQREDSIIQTLISIFSWMPAAQARIHPPPLREYRLSDAQDVGVAPM